MKTTLRVLSCVLLLTFVAPAIGDDELNRASWEAPSTKAVRDEIDRIVAANELDELAKAKLDALWTGVELSNDNLLEQLGTTITLIDERALALVSACRSADSPDLTVKFTILDDENLDAFVSANLHLLHGRWLAQHELYDEVLSTLESVQPQNVVDPAALLFYKSVASHHLLKKELCLDSVNKLLENEESIPFRYKSLANLMKADIAPLKTDSLDEIARLMDDIQRRLNFGRAGKTVRDQEENVVAKLDKMIEELEEQQKKGGASSPGAGSNPSKPMNDSQAGGGTGDGEVPSRRTGNGSGWGNLPPKERQEALQQIAKELPAHFREVIQEYFRKIAREDGG
ncbi:MAG: hypothetical protein ACI9G1_001218 [Pirellulaceae bacterium]|jgi:hypothetical protein